MMARSHLAPPTRGPLRNPLTAWALVMAAAMPAATLPSPAQAQNVGDNFVNPTLPLEYDRGQNTGVLDRQRPEYEALGIRLGGFTVQPRIEAAAGYTDNVYQTPQRTADGYAVIAPEMQLASNWPRNELGLDAGGSFWRYFHETRRDQDGWHVGATARYDIGGAGAIAISGRTEHATEPATSAAYPTAAAQASQYQVTTAHFGPSYAFGRVKLQGAYDFITYSFDPYATFAGTVVDQSNRDSTGQNGTARGEYALTPDTSVFLQADYDRLTYSHPLLPGVANRNSVSYRAIGGVSFDIATKIRGAIGVGYMSRDYDSPLYQGISGITGEAKVDYFVDSLTTISLTGRRIIEDSPYVNSSGFVNTSVALRVDHELLRNVLLNVQGAYEHDSFTGLGETVDILRVSAGARYLMSRSLGLGLSVSHDSRATSGSLGLPTYAETRVMVSAVVQK